MMPDESTDSDRLAITLVNRGPALHEPPTRPARQTRRHPRRQSSRGDDWYANLLWNDRRKCLLLAPAATLFPVFVADVRKPDLQPPGPFVVAQIRAALTDERLPASVLGQLDADDVRLARTASRSILGFMNDSALACRTAVEHAGGLEHIDLDALNRSLRRQLHNRGGYRQPLDLVLEHLTAG